VYLTATNNIRVVNMSLGGGMNSYKSPAPPAKLLRGLVDAIVSRPLYLGKWRTKFTGHIHSAVVSRWPITVALQRLQTDAQGSDGYNY